MAQPGTGVYFNGQLVGQYVEDPAGGLKTICGSCQKCYKCKTTLVRHWRQMHGLQGGLCCRHCGKMFGQKSNFESHQAMCSGREQNPQQALFAGAGVALSDSSKPLPTSTVNLAFPAGLDINYKSENREEYSSPTAE